MTAKTPTEIAALAYRISTAETFYDATAILESALTTYGLAQRREGLEEAKRMFAEWTVDHFAEWTVDHDFKSVDLRSVRKEMRDFARSLTPSDEEKK